MHAIDDGRRGDGRVVPGDSRRSAGFCFAGIVLVALAGCASVSVERAREGILAWPAPPERPRFVYEGFLRDSRSVEVGGEHEMRRLLMGGDTPRGLAKPLSVAARGGRVYVTDTEARRVQVFDIARRRFFALGWRGEGRLQKPAGIAVDALGNVYVADIGTRQVVMYDAWGLFKRRFGDPAVLQRPTGVAVDAAGERIYIVDAGGVDSDRHEVRVHDADGRLLRILGGRGAEPGRFNLPTDAVVDADGTLYVLDAGNFRVQAFDRAGGYLRSFGAVGNGAGQFSRPRGIAVDADRNIYVSDAWYGNVQVFDREGTLLLAVGARGERDAPGRYGLAAGVAVDETQRLYVVDQFFHKIEVIRRLAAEKSGRLARLGNE